MARDGSAKNAKDWSLMTPHAREERPRKRICTRHFPREMRPQIAEGSEEKERGLRIQDIDDNALPKRRGQFNAGASARDLRDSSRRSFVYAQVDQVMPAPRSLSTSLRMPAADDISSADNPTGTPRPMMIAACPRNEARIAGCRQTGPALRPRPRLRLRHVVHWQALVSGQQRQGRADEEQERHE